MPVWICVTSTALATRNGATGSRVTVLHPPAPDEQPALQGLCRFGTRDGITVPVTHGDWRCAPCPSRGASSPLLCISRRLPAVLWGMGDTTTRLLKGFSTLQLLHIKLRRMLVDRTHGLCLFLERAAGSPCQEGRSRSPGSPPAPLASLALTAASLMGCGWSAGRRGDGQDGAPGQPWQQARLGPAEGSGPGSIEDESRAEPCPQATHEGREGAWRAGLGTRSHGVFSGWLA